MTADDPGASVNAWVNVVRRARLHETTKLIALLLASYASPDGTNIFPGVARLAVQSGHGYRTVQRHLAHLRTAGLIEPLPRRNTPRHFSTGYRLILAADLLDRIDVPTPATEDAAVDKLTSLFRGKHTATARHKDDVQSAREDQPSGLPDDDSARRNGGVQNDDCTPPDDTTARHVPHPDQQEQHPTHHRPLHKTNPPYDEADVRNPRTGSARASGSDDCTPSPPPDTRTRAGTAEAARAQGDELARFIREHPESEVTP